MRKDLIKTGSNPVLLKSRANMKQEFSTYLKTIRKSKALSTTLSDTELEDELDDNNDE